ncbi:EamA family transporter [Haladaptatus halobius]|uniref:EamA family transporter n=1 Tax=Haladaptatus halobius TaxID=2884875 RepID=UPI001D0A82E7|nr:EamA family transporter [Haladaptatus halobius]
MVEWWFVVAFLAAILKTAYSVVQKRLTLEYDGLELSYITSILGMLFMTPIGVWYLSHIDMSFTPPVIMAITISGVANICAIVTFLTALKLEDLSIVTPLMQSTPIVVAITEPLVLATHYDTGIVLGSAVAVVGAYTLLNDAGGLTVPIKRITDKPILLALTAALLFASTSLANRFVTTRIPPLFYAFSIYLFMAIGFVSIQIFRDRHLLTTELFRGRLILLGGLTALRTSVTYVAFSLAIASRVSIVLQISILLNVLAGGFFFSEKNLLWKLVGTLCIVAGVILTL